MIHKCEYEKCPHPDRLILENIMFFSGKPYHSYCWYWVYRKWIDDSINFTDPKDGETK